MSNEEEYPAPTELEVVCTQGLEDEEILSLIEKKQAENLPATHLVVFTRVPIKATLTPAKDENSQALIQVTVNRDDVTLHSIDDLLGYFHALVEVYKKVNVSFEIEGGNQFSEKLSDLYANAPSEEEVLEYVARQKEAIENAQHFNAALATMQSTGEYHDSHTEQDVLDWYERYKTLQEILPPSKDNNAD